VGGYQEARSAFHENRNISLGGARVPILFPGEKINAVTATRPNSAFEAFQSTFLRNFATSVGMSYEQVSSDWSKSNYSSARGAILEAWKTIQRRRNNFENGFATPIFGCFLEESFDVDDIPLPKGAPDYNEYRTAYSGVRWLGPGRLAIDSVKEAQGSVLGMEAGLTTLEQEAMDAGGDYDEILDQRAIEIARFKELGIPVPAWGQQSDEIVASEKVG
jgi:lambda family phage portal protein